MPKKAAAAKAEEITVEGIFGPGGLLEKRHPGYEFRPSQLEMARIVDEAFQKHQHVVIEAGTGTGKTLAYLIPAIRSGRRVVVSTATKSLQEQLFQKDVPFLQKHFAPNLKAALMKGRANFLCRQKVHQMEGQPVLKGIDEIDWFSQIRDWEKLTETGDRSELTFLPDDAELWNRIDARSDLCSGQKCAEFQRCFITAMHQRAAGSGPDHRESPSFFRRSGHPPGRFRLDPARIFRGGFRRGARNRGRGQRLFRAPAFELSLRGAGARHRKHAAHAAHRSGAAAQASGARARTRAQLLREFSRARRALPVWPRRAASVSRTAIARRTTSWRPP